MWLRLLGLEVAGAGGTWACDLERSFNLVLSDVLLGAGGGARVYASHHPPLPCTSGPFISQVMPVLISTKKQASLCRAGTHVRIFNYGTCAK